MRISAFVKETRRELLIVFHLSCEEKFFFLTLFPEKTARSLVQRDDDFDCRSAAAQSVGIPTVGFRRRRFCMCLIERYTFFVCILVHL